RWLIRKLRRELNATRDGVSARIRLQEGEQPSRLCKQFGIVMCRGRFDLRFWNPIAGGYRPPRACAPNLRKRPIGKVSKLEGMHRMLAVAKCRLMAILRSEF